MNVLGIIPARGGSKGLPDKNTRILANNPLLYYTIECAKKSNELSQFIVSTDDDKIAELATALGANVPFKRPKDLAGDETPMIDVIDHAVTTFEKDTSSHFDIIVLLQPTSPLRKAKHIDDAVTLLISTGADSVVSVVEVPHNFNPYSVMKIENERLVSFMAEEGNKILRRQDKSSLFARNGAAVYALRRETVMDQHSIFGDDCRPLIMNKDESVDIDDEFDLHIAEMLLKSHI